MLEIIVRQRFRTAVINLSFCICSGETDTDLDVLSNTSSPNRKPSLSSRGDSLPTDYGSIDDLSVLTTGLSNLDIVSLFIPV